jgi:hypothetical protein
MNLENFRLFCLLFHGYVYYFPFKYGELKGSILNGSNCQYEKISDKSRHQLPSDLQAANKKFPKFHNHST